MEFRLVFILLCLAIVCQGHLDKSIESVDSESDSDSDSDSDSFSEVDLDEFEKNPKRKLSDLDEFERNLPNKTIIIHNHSTKHLPKWTEKVLKSIKLWNLMKPSYADYNDIDKANEIQIFNYPRALETLHLFGDLIRKVHVKFTDANSNESKKIGKYIDDYCPNLVELKLEIEQGNPLEYWTLPFKHLTHLSFDVKSLPPKQHNSLQLNVIFPQLQTLSISLGSNTHSYFYCHFHNLQHVIINEPNADSINDTYLNSLFKANPHIQSVTVQTGRPDLLRKINDALRKLKSLTIESFEDLGDRMITFDSLTTLSLRNSLKVPKHLNAPNLQELEMAFTTDDLDAWTQFLSNYSKLKRLRLHYHHIYHDDFIQLTNNLQQLEEVSVKRYQDAYYGLEWTFPSVDAMTKFLENHDQLEKLETDACADYDQAELHRKFQDKWQIIPQNGGFVLLKRHQN